ncbi:MAG: hypothetical protein JNM94_00695 [Phycisphaerae bacterium]|nr:hypothetical protein [Phycisphaerae bacterium]
MESVIVVPFAVRGALAEDPAEADAEAGREADARALDFAAPFGAGFSEERPAGPMTAIGFATAFAATLLFT